MEGTPSSCLGVAYIETQRSLGGIAAPKQGRAPQQFAIPRERSYDDSQYRSH